MDPVTLAALITAGGQLATGLGTSLYQGEQQKIRQIQGAEKDKFDALASAAQQESQMKRQGLSNLIAAYRSALGR